MGGDSAEPFARSSSEPFARVRSDRRGCPDYASLWHHAVRDGCADGGVAN